MYDLPHGWGVFAWNQVKSYLQNLNFCNVLIMFLMVEISLTSSKIFGVLKILIIDNLYQRFLKYPSRFH